MANSAFDSLFTPAYTNSIQDTGDGPGSSPGSSQSHKYVEEDGKHKGLAGVGRDILGTLGDFLLTRLHMPAMYAPAQKQRELSAAGQGFDQDPYAAIDRVKSVDFKQGTQMQQNQQSLDSLKDYRESAETIRAARAQMIAAQQAAIARKGTAGSIQSLRDKDGNFVPNFAQIYTNLKPSLDSSFPGQNLPDPSDPNLEAKLNAYIGSDIGAKELARQGQGQQKIDNQADQFADTLPIKQQTADAATSRAESYGKSVDNNDKHATVKEGQTAERDKNTHGDRVVGNVIKAAGVQVQAAGKQIQASKAAQYKDGMSKTIGGKTYVRTKGVWQPQ